MAPKVLVVLTSHEKIAKTGGATGWYLPELAHPYDILSAKAEIVVASPKGGVAPLDPSSIEVWKEDASSQAFLKDKKSVWENTKPIKDFLGKAGDFAAVFYPGGHGPMFDLVDDADSIALIKEFYAAGKPVSAVCHGPAAFLNVEVDGKSLLSGREATGFTNDEEDSVKMRDAMPFMLEDAIKKTGANFVKSEQIYLPKVCSDGKVITGQNPESSKGVAEEIIKAAGL